MTEQLYIAYIGGERMTKSVLFAAPNAREADHKAQEELCPFGYYVEKLVEVPMQTLYEEGFTVEEHTSSTKRGVWELNRLKDPRFKKAR